MSTGNTVENTHYFIFQRPEQCNFGNVAIIDAIFAFLKQGFVNSFLEYILQHLPTSLDLVFIPIHEIIIGASGPTFKNNIDPIHHNVLDTATIMPKSYRIFYITVLHYLKLIPGKPTICLKTLFSLKRY